MDRAGLYVPGGKGGATPLISSLLMNAVPRDRSGSAGGIIASARTLGQTMGAALVALIFGLFDFSSGAVAAADAARAAIWLSAGFAATALVIGSLRLRH